ncbi:LysR family transcriptional regulator [Kosakonia sp. BK9b]
MNIEQLKIFITLVRTKSIKETAVITGEDELLIIKNLQQLENSIGFDLVKRGKDVRKIILSEKGAAFYALTPRMITLLGEVDEIRKSSALR